jgi:hypothetical protein
VALEQNNTAFEFETMLRRHLKRAPITEACDGFDADTANAYLENAIGATARSRYESHLGGCQSCRHHLIQLSRLIQLPQTEPQFVNIAKPASIWSHWKSVVAEWTEWLDFSLGKQGWATAGAAAAILIGVVSIQLWRQQSAQPIQKDIATAGGNVEQTPPPLQGNDESGTAAQPEATSDLASNLALNKVPTPQVSPSVVSVQMVENGFSTGGARLGSVSSLTGGSSNSFDLKLTVPPSPPQPQLTTNILYSSVADRTAFGPPVQPVTAESAPIPPAAETQRSESVVAAHITPLPSDNPMVKKPTETKAPRSSLDKALSFLPARKTDSERKLEEKEIEPDAPKVLSIRRRDKVFNYQGGFWVDSGYKPEMAWRVTKVTIDSDEYKQLLSAEPMLKEYFAHGPAIVVWKDKIYKIVAK